MLGHVLRPTTELSKVNLLFKYISSLYKFKGWVNIQIWKKKFFLFTSHLLLNINVIWILTCYLLLSFCRFLLPRNTSWVFSPPNFCRIFSTLLKKINLSMSSINIPKNKFYISKISFLTCNVMKNLSFLLNPLNHKHNKWIIHWQKVSLERQEATTYI